MIGFEDCSTGVSFIPGTPMAWEFMGPKEDLAIVILLNGHAVKLPSKYLCL